jgi:hypothetical protein
VYGDARVCGDAKVFGNAQVFEDAVVFGNARVFAGHVRQPQNLAHLCLLNIPCTYVVGGYLTIGCQSHHIEDAFWDSTAFSKFGDNYQRLFKYGYEAILDMCIAVEEMQNDKHS